MVLVDGSSTCVPEEKQSEIDQADHSQGDQRPMLAEVICSDKLEGKLIRD